MDRDEVGKFAVKGTGYVEGFSLYVGHEQDFGQWSSLWVLLDHLSRCDHPFDIAVGDSPSAHALLGMGGDEIAIVSNCPAQGWAAVFAQTCGF